MLIGVCRRYGAAQGGAWGGFARAQRIWGMLRSLTVRCGFAEDAHAHSEASAVCVPSS